jgi:hypothetical protein
VLTDEQLARQIRSALQERLAGLHPSEDLLARVLAHDGPALRSGRGRSSRPRWLESGVLVTAISTTIAIAIAVIAIVSLHAAHRQPSTQPPSGQPPSGPTLPLHPSHQQLQEETYLDKTEGTLLRRDSACFRVTLGGGSPGRKPSLSNGSPPQPLLSILGVLRQPATAADKLPPRIIGIPPRVFPTGTIPPFHDVYVRYIRYARHRDGANYYLVPAANVNYRLPIPARCYSKYRALFRHELSTIPRRLQAGTLALEPRFLASLRQSTLPFPGVCLDALNSTGNGGGCGGGSTVSDIEEGHTLTSGAPGGVPVVSGLAPDGVRTVTFFYHGRYPGRPLTVLAINNVFILHDPQDRLPDNGFPYMLVWRASNGSLVKTIHYN